MATIENIEDIEDTQYVPSYEVGQVEGSLGELMRQLRRQDSASETLSQQTLLEVLEHTQALIVLSRSDVLDQALSPDLVGVPVEQVEELAERLDAVADSLGDLASTGDERVDSPLREHAAELTELYSLVQELAVESAADADDPGKLRLELAVESAADADDPDKPRLEL